MRFFPKYPAGQSSELKKKTMMTFNSNKNCKRSVIVSTCISLLIHAFSGTVDKMKHISANLTILFDEPGIVLTISNWVFYISCEMFKNHLQIINSKIYTSSGCLIDSKENNLNANHYESH